MPKYPAVVQLALDIRTIPTSSCEYERLFSELGGLLNPRRDSVGPELMAVLQCIRPWIRGGLMDSDDKVDETLLPDEQLVSLYSICSWVDPTQ